MRILLYGESWEGTHVNVMERVLTEKGIACRIFDFYSLLSYHTRFDLANRALRRIFYFHNEAVINRLLLKEIDTYQPNILLISKGVNIYPETLQYCQKQSILIANWNPDNFFNPKNSSRHLVASFGLYDYVFSARKHLFDEYRAAGIKNPVFLEWYYIPWLHHKPDTLTDKSDRMLRFVGSYSQRRDDIICSINKSFPVEVWGGGWGLSKARGKTHITIKQQILPQSSFPALMSRTLVNLNILTIENDDQTNLKIFEIPASYGLLLTEYTPETKEILQEGCFYYDGENSEKLNEQLRHIFNEDEKALKQKKNMGYERLMHGHHAINDRVDTLLEMIR